MPVGKAPLTLGVRHDQSATAQQADAREKSLDRLCRNMKCSREHQPALALTQNVPIMSVTMPKTQDIVRLLNSRFT